MTGTNELKILIIAYYFPPDSSSGSFRPLYFARHLHEMGEKLYVLTAREKDYLPDQPKDHKMLEKVVNKIEIIRTRVYRPREAVIRLRNFLFNKTNSNGGNACIANNDRFDLVKSKSSLIQQIKDTFTDLLSTPDPHIGWISSAIAEGKRIIKNENIDVIYATGSPWTCLIIGAVLKRLTGKPLVMDFRDPWVSNPGFMVRSKIIRFIETYMEQKVISFADKIITNTYELEHDFLSRFPKLDKNQINTISNGFEEHIESKELNNEKLTLTHAGTLYFSRNPKYLLQAVINLIENKTISKGNLNIIFLGGISIQDPELDIILKHPLLQNVVKILPRLPYKDAADYQSKSDVLLLIQPDFPLQVPRKLYEYMAFRKPVFGITNSSGATARVIKEKKIGVVTANQTKEIESALKDIYERWSNGFLGTLPENTCDEFMNKNLTTQLQTVFCELE